MQIIQNKKSYGFTLIEVIIAMTIIAIACVAVFELVGETIKQSSRLQSHDMGKWIAQDALIEIQRGMSDLPLKGNPTKGSVVMRGETWSWVATYADVQPTTYDELVIIKVQSPDSDKTVWTAKDFIRLTEVKQ